ncbi:MAG: metallophosphoesterase [Sulfurovum sp.]
MIELKLFIYYGSWLIFPLLIWFINKRHIILIILSLLFIYARFIEPQILLVHQYKINVGFKAKYALISDIHLGIYNDELIMERIVEKVAKLDIDALLIAGDFTYEPNPNQFHKLFASLQRVKVPIYAVLGNHDRQRPGADIRVPLETALQDLGVHIITNRAIELNGVTLLGLGSNWAENDKVELLDSYSKEDNLVVLTHNPDTLLKTKKHHYPDLTLAGHTHGGQVRIPYLYKKVIPVRGDILWDKGLYEYKNGKIFISSGIGMVGLPLRFLIPPTIDVLWLE